MLSDANWQPLLSSLVDGRSADLLAAVTDDIRNWYGSGTRLDTKAYFEQIRMIDMRPELIPAFEKAIRDYEHGRSVKSA